MFQLALHKINLSLQNYVLLNIYFREQLQLVGKNNWKESAQVMNYCGRKPEVSVSVYGPYPHDIVCMMVYAFCSELLLL